MSAFWPHIASFEERKKFLVCVCLCFEFEGDLITSYQSFKNFDFFSAFFLFFGLNSFRSILYRLSGLILFHMTNKISVLRVMWT